MRGEAIALGNRGIFASLSGKLSQALFDLRLSQRKAREVGDERTYFSARLAEARILSLRGRPEATQVIRECLEFGRRRDRELWAQAFLEKAEASFRAGGLQRAEKLCREAEKILANNATETFFQLRALAAEIAREKGEPERSLEFLSEPSGTSVSPFLSCRLRRARGEAWRDLGPSWADRAEEELKAAFSLAEELHFPYELHRAGLALAVYLYYIGELPEALRLAREARSFFERQGFPWETKQAQEVVSEVENELSSQDRLAPASGA